MFYNIKMKNRGKEWLNEKGDSIPYYIYACARREIMTKVDIVAIEIIGTIEIIGAIATIKT